MHSDGRLPLYSVRVGNTMGIGLKCNRLRTSGGAPPRGDPSAKRTTQGVSVTVARATRRRIALTNVAGRDPPGNRPITALRL